MTLSKKHGCHQSHVSNSARHDIHLISSLRNGSRPRASCPSHDNVKSLFQFERKTEAKLFISAPLHYTLDWATAVCAVSRRRDQCRRYPSRDHRLYTAHLTTYLVHRVPCAVCHMPYAIRYVVLFPVTCVKPPPQDTNPFGDEGSSRGGWALEVEAAELKGLFEEHQPVDGKLSAVNARTPLVQSGLPNDTLRYTRCGIGRARKGVSKRR